MPEKEFTKHFNSDGSYDEVETRTFDDGSKEIFRQEGRRVGPMVFDDPPKRTTHTIVDAKGNSTTKVL